MAKRKSLLEEKKKMWESRIRELEAELAVRDNMGDKVLRILREATGKRGFHSEMEAAEAAAKEIEELRANGAYVAYVDYGQDWLAARDRRMVAKGGEGGAA
jgi:hypothetical protein